MRLPCSPPSDLFPHMFAYVHACMHVHVYVCMHVCVHVCMHACMHVCTYVCICACMYACAHVCMHVCMCAYLFVCLYVCVCLSWLVSARMCACQILALVGAHGGHYVWLFGWHRLRARIALLVKEYVCPITCHKPKSMKGLPLILPTVWSILLFH